MSAIHSQSSSDALIGISAKNEGLTANKAYVHLYVSFGSKVRPRTFVVYFEVQITRIFCRVGVIEEACSP